MDHAKKIGFYIKENSKRARVAATFLREDKMAMVMGKTIYLHRVSKEDFLNHSHWLRHELMHVLQYQKSGTFLFVLKYLAQSILHGYKNNLYEQEARKAEQCEEIENQFEFEIKK